MSWFKRWLLKMALKTGGAKKMVKTIQEFLAGKKSYLASIGLLITSLIEFSVDGDLASLVQRIFECLAIAGIRAGIAKK